MTKNALFTSKRKQFEVNNVTTTTKNAKQKKKTQNAGGAMTQWGKTTGRRRSQKRENAIWEKNCGFCY